MTEHKTAQPDLGGLSPWAPQLAQTFVALASDIALLLDANGVICSLAQGGSVAAVTDASEWVGKRWVDTVTSSSRAKVEQLLEEVRANGMARRREVNHTLSNGTGSIAVAYTVARLGSDGPLLAVGRDLSVIAAVQQRFVAAQQEMERGYWRVRQAEARYRLLFQVATDAVLVVDAQTLNILEANQAASQLFELAVDRMVGRPAAFGFERLSRDAVNSLLATARASGQASEIRAQLLGRVTATSVAATPFCADDAMRLLVRVRTLDMPGSSADLNATLARLVDSASDGVVVTDPAGRILVANPAFLKLVKMSTELTVKGRPLMDWIGVSEAQFATLLSQVRSQGIARRMESRLMASDAQVSQVEVSAALLTEGDQECIGFTIHFMARGEANASATPADELRADLEQICNQIGHTALPDLMGQAGAMLEQHMVRLALDRCNGEVAAAASLLGISVDRVRLINPEITLQ